MKLGPNSNCPVDNLKKKPFFSSNERIKKWSNPELDLMLKTKTEKDINQWRSQTN